MVVVVSGSRFPLLWTPHLPSASRELPLGMAIIGTDARTRLVLLPRRSYKEPRRKGRRRKKRDQSIRKGTDQHFSFYIFAPTVRRHYFNKEALHVPSVRPYDTPPSDATATECDGAARRRLGLCSAFDVSLDLS